MEEVCSDDMLEAVLEELLLEENEAGLVLDALEHLLPLEVKVLQENHLLLFSGIKFKDR